MSKPFNKLNFSLPFSMETAVPVDYNSYFTTYAEASAAAATAEDAGSSDSIYYVGQTVTVVDSVNGTTKLYQIGHDKRLHEVAHSEVLDGYLPTVDNNGQYSTNGKSLSMKTVSSGEDGSDTRAGILANGYVGVSFVHEPDDPSEEPYEESTYIRRSDISHSSGDDTFVYGLPKSSGALALKADIGIKEFSTTDTYSVGEYVIRGGSVWKCISEVAVPGSWSGTDNWTEQYPLDRPKTNFEAITSIEGKIPSQATSSNQLADKDFVNSSIATNTAYFLGTLDYATDLGLPAPTSVEDVDNDVIATALDGYDFTPLTASNNDYCFVKIDYVGTVPEDEYRRFKYNGDEDSWKYEYTLNNSSFTANQWASINSGITSGLVDKLEGIDAGAQVNVIETIQVNSASLPVANKTVNITAVTGVKGNSESTYRTGQVNITPANIGAAVPSDITITDVKVNGTSLPITNKAVDVTVPVKATVAPVIAGTADIGNSAKYAAEDHVHPAETRIAAYALPDECFPITYTYDGTAYAIASNDGLSFIEDGTNISVVDASANTRLAGFDKTSPHAYETIGNVGITNLKFNGVSPVVNTSPVLRDDAVYVRDVQVAKEVDLKAGIDSKLSPYPFETVDASVASKVYLLQKEAFPVTFTYDGVDYSIYSNDGLSINMLTSDAGVMYTRDGSVSICSFVRSGVDMAFSMAGDVTDLKFNGASGISGTSPKLDESNGEYRALSLAPYANNMFEPSTGSSYYPFVEMVPEGYGDGKMRDLWFTVDCTGLEGDSVSILWDDSTFTPCGGDTTNMELYAGRQNIFMLCEYAPGRFMVVREVFTRDTIVNSVNGQTGNVVLSSNDVGALASTDVVTPSTSAEDEGKAADAYRTGIALAGKLGNSGNQTINDNGNLTFSGPNSSYAKIGISNLGLPVLQARLPHSNPGGQLTIPTPSSDDTLALVSQIYSAVQQIAPEFNASTTYVKNDLCSKDGVVYQYTNTSSHSGTWDSDDWTAKKVSELFLPLTGGSIDGNIDVRGNIVATQGFDLGYGLGHGHIDLSGVDLGYDGVSYDYHIEFPSASGIFALLQNLAAEYSASETYALNQLCIRYGHLYRCTTAITIPETWNSSHWTEAPVQDVLATLAPLTSPALSGTPTTTDITQSSPDGQIVNKKYVTEQIDTDSPLVARSFTTTGATTDNANNTVIYFRPRYFGMNDGDRFKGFVVRTRYGGTARPTVYARLRRYSDNEVLAISDVQSWPSTNYVDVPFTFPVSVTLPIKDNYYYIDFVTENSTTATPVSMGLRVYNYSPTTNPDCYFGTSTIVPILTARYYSFASDLQTTGNLVTSISAQSDDIHYPSAKCMWDALEDKVPNTLTVNSKALSADITLDASDVNALGNSGDQELDFGSSGLITFEHDSDGPYIKMTDKDGNNAVIWYDGTIGVKASGASAYTNYNMPATSGTLALDSQLADYLPLTGGTMTGAIRLGLNGWCISPVNGGTLVKPNGYYIGLDKLAFLADTMRFSTGVSYAIGDVCFYNGSFYRCSTAHSAGEWNASHFTEVIGGLSSGTPTTTQPPSGDSSTRIATTEFVATALTGKVDVTDFNDQSLLIAQNTENIAANTDDITELSNSKLDSSVGAPVFSPLSTYSLHEYVTNGGQLYRATTAITATGAWDPTKWEIVDMTSPDATLDITSQGQLRVVAADGTTLWHQGYNLGTTSSTSLSTDAVNCYTYSVNATGETVFALPTPANGKVGDFVLDISNPSLSSTAADFPPTFSTESTYASGAVVYYNSTLWECLTAVSTAGAWTGSANWVEAYPSMTISQYASENVQIVVPDNDELVDMFTFKPGTMCELYFTTTAFNVDGKPTWKVVRQDVKTAGGGS